MVGISTPIPTGGKSKAGAIILHDSSCTGEIAVNTYTSLSYLFSLNKLCDYKFEEIANYTVASNSSNYDIGMVKPDLQLFTCNGFKFENRHSIAIAQWEVKGGAIIYKQTQNETFY